MSDKDEIESDEENETITNADVVTKYKASAEIVNQALATIVKECTPGKKIVDICVIGDKFIADKLAVIFTKGKIEKGVAFPVSISVNNCVGHFSPLLGDTTVLNDGDVAKIDLGVHIDGYIACVAHTVVVQEQSTVTQPQPVTGRKADVICAAHYAAEAALRLMKPGKKNSDVTEVIKKVAEQFKCEPVEGVLSHSMKRFIIDGNNTIINKQTLEHKVEEFEFEENQVYTLDIVMSTGEGKTKEVETRTLIYKRAVDQNYNLKMATSRYVLNEIQNRFPTLPFALRALDEKKGKLGILECLNHGLVVPYPVLFEKNGEFVAQFKFTVLITSTNSDRLTSHALPFVQSEHKITDPAIDQLLKTGTKRASQAKKNKKKKAKLAAQPNQANEKQNVDAMDTSK